MKLYTFSLFIIVLLSALFGCTVAVPVTTQEDIQQLEEVKGLFISQIENDMHPVIWVYLDEVLHDPEVFACNDLSIL